jgi:flagellar biosynthesis anti-sigma factor FlgM
MRIYGSSDFPAKPEAADGKKRDRALSGVREAARPAAAEEVTKGGQGPAAQRAGAPAPAAGEAVVLSSRATRFTEVSSEQQAARAQRLAEVKKLLDDGAYQVDFDRLADGLMEEEVQRAKP